MGVSRVARARVVVAALVATLLLAACGGDGADAAGEANGADGQASVGTVTLAATELGEVLVDGEGRTLYLFDPDEGGASTCDGGCAVAWPPVAGPVTAGDGADAALVGTVPRDDGSTQATYAGWPLYRYAADAGPGDVSGQGVEGVWWVLSGAGERVTDAVEGEPPPAPPVSPVSPPDDYY